MTWRVGKRQARHIHRDGVLVAIAIGEEKEARLIARQIALACNLAPAAAEPVVKPSTGQLVPSRPCFCGAIVIAFDPCDYFGAVHGLKECRVPDPDKMCWCGRTRLEHQNAEGHAPGMSPYGRKPLEDRVAQALKEAESDPFYLEEVERMRRQTR